MFDDDAQPPNETSSDPVQRANEQAEMLRLNAELAAVFEGTRKFDAQMIALDVGMMRKIQLDMARLAKSRLSEMPVIHPSHRPHVDALLTYCDTQSLTTNDYYYHRRPGEVMLARWLAGEEVQIFYDRMQAHFEAGWSAFLEDERSANEWKQDESTSRYVAALESIKEDMSKRYARQAVTNLYLAFLSTQTADEINLLMISDQIMGIGAESLVGTKSAPSDDTNETELAWFFKLFSLRAMVNGVERMCFFAFLQKSGDDFEMDE